MKYFRESELWCRCGCKLFNYEEMFLTKLDRLRELFGAPIVVTSGARCEKHNKAVGGVETSYHIASKIKKANAVDLGIIDVTDKYRIIEIAIDLGFKGIGVKHTMIHLDDRDGPKAFWLYGSKNSS